MPVKNLLSSTLYNVTLDVTAMNGASGTDFILIQTSQEIDEGLLDISPISGVAGETDFNISFFLWNANEGSLTFDLIFYEEINFVFLGQKITSKQNLNPIALGIK